MEESLARIGNMVLPAGAGKNLGQTLAYAGEKSEAGAWFGKTLALSIAAGAAALAAALLLKSSSVVSAAAFALAFLAYMLTAYMVLYFKVEDRRHRVEKILPDALQLISANIKAGMSPVVAMRIAARPEFGPLEEEIKYVTTKSMGVESFSKALQEMSRNIKSDVLSRTVSLFATSLKSGGNIAKILEVSAEDIRRAQELKTQLVTGTNMYVAFIVFTTLVGMPSLLAVSMQFVELTARLSEKAQSSLAGQIGVVLAKPFSSQFIFNTSLVMLAATAMLAAMFVGVIREGKELYGLKWGPFLALGAIASFFIMKNYVLRLILGA